MTRRVVVTGMGWITPLGQDLHTVWSALTSGQSGIKPTTRFDASTFPNRSCPPLGRQFGWG
ncbi:MAG: beta-ketoacyl synthase N-terminal-like domain-containing protein, partial [Planctomycetota bacterium]